MSKKTLIKVPYKHICLSAEEFETMKGALHSDPLAFIQVKCVGIVTDVSTVDCVKRSGGQNFK
jgi:hypothetical protein